MPVKKLDLNLRQDMKKLEVRAKRKVLARILEGNWTALLKGRGMEFAGFRRYTYGDDASRIDWGASLRAKETLIREFEEYKNVNILFLVDVSNSMLFASEKKLKAEYAAEVVFNLATATLDNGEAVGYALFTDHIVAKGLPAIGKEGAYDIAAALSNPKFYGGNKNFRRVVGEVNAMLKQKALLILVSDFIGFDEGWERFVRMLSERYDLIGIMIRDPRDLEMPDMHGQFLLEDPYSSERIVVDVDDYRQLYAENAKNEEAYIKQLFESAQASVISLRTDQDMFNPIIAFMRRRNRIIQS
jgi:uncharacterized protein (DUF58 family)